MYLAQFQGDDGTTAEGLLTLTRLPPAGSPAGADWWDGYVRLVRSVNVDSFAIGRRLVFGGPTQVRQVLLVAGDERRSAELRRFLAPFTRLETFVPGAAELPVTRSEFDAVADDFPLIRSRIDLSGFSVGQTWLACDFRVARFLDELATEAAAHGYRLGYQVNLRAPDVDREQVRRARLNALAVGALAGAPNAVRELQEGLAQRLTHAVALCDEYVGVDSEEAVDWISDALGRHFRSSFRELGFDTPTWEFVDGGFDDDLMCPPCESAPLPDDELAARAVDDRELATLLTWRPPASFEAPHSQYIGDSEGAAVDVSDLPQPYDGGDAYFFVSYKRSDLGLIAPTMREIQTAGWRLWYDRGIPGGADWNDVLEERIASSTGLVLFLSEPAIESKYVRREVRFADSLDKPIVVVRTDAAEPRHGLRLLLEQYQMLRMAERDFLDQLGRALARVDDPRAPVGR